MSAVKVQQRRVHTRLIQGLEVAGAELAEHAIWEQQEQRELSRVQQIANKTQIEAREFSTLLPGLDTLFNNWNARQPSLCRFFLCSESTACISFSMEDSSTLRDTIQAGEPAAAAAAATVATMIIRIRIRIIITM